MTEYSMDENGEIIKDPATADDLSRWANEYHRKYFSGGPEPTIKVAFTSELGQAGCFIPADEIVLMPQALAAFEKSCRIVLLHEMVHVRLFMENGDPDPGHGERFRAEINRLFSCGAYGNLL
jgi:predicted SprT family Zn-dependent metalloprotease